MKSILLSACFIAFACSLSLAQSNNQIQQAPVSKAASVGKTQFASGIKELEKNMKAGNAEKAHTSYMELQRAMELSMAESKGKLQAAATEEERTKQMDNFRKKQSLYVEIHNLSKDLSANNKAIQSKLNEFSKIAY